MPAPQAVPAQALLATSRIWFCRWLTCPFIMPTSALALLSVSVLLAWKYLMPWLLMLLIAWPTSVAVAVVPLAL